MQVVTAAVANLYMDLLDFSFCLFPVVAEFNLCGS